MAPEQDGFQIDPALLQDFLLESRESLEGLNELFVLLEANPADHALIDRIFRPVHSIKGNSSFFGLTNIKNFSHSFENLLQDLRSDNLNATREVIDVLLKGVDTLLEMIGRLEKGETSTELTPPEEELLAQVARIRESKEDAAAEDLSAARKAIGRIREEAPESLATEIATVANALDAMLARLKPETAAKAADDGALRYFAGAADVTDLVARQNAFLKDISVKSHDEPAYEGFLDDIRSMIAQAQEQKAKHIQNLFEEALNDVVSIHDSDIGFDDLLSDLVREKFEKATAALARKSAGEGDAPSASGPAAAKTAPDAADKGEAAGSGKTIRVAEEKVDSFMHFVGELIITSEVFSYIQKKLEGVKGIREVVSEFKQAILSFNELSTNLQRSLMEVRRVPLKNILQKLPRMVRDLANDLGKEIDLEVDGQMIQIDKSLIEKLESPVTHMVRNCIDHAIEQPEEREAAGKPRRGTVRVTAEATEEVFTLSIADDGRGLDVEALKAKAVEKGQITPDRAASMTDKEAFLLIFGAGVSTARTVTDISGRGVGMDVVRTNITEMSGTVDIDSTPGTGTTVTITLPMSITLLVVDGLVARVGGVTYIIPLANIEQSVHPERGDVSTVQGKGEMVNVRGRLHPLIRLHKLFGVEPTQQNPWETIVVIVSDEQRSCALMVDELLGQQSVVLKELTEYFQGLDIIRGGAILGSGRVGLVLDVEEIIATTTATRARKG